MSDRASCRGRGPGGPSALGSLCTWATGNLDAKRDWGHAHDYVDAMWRMLQQDTPGDYVVATGEMHSVREFADLAFEHAGLDANDFIAIDPRYFRPAEVDALPGDATDTRANLGWAPRTTFRELVREMYEADLELAMRERTLRDAGLGQAA